MLAVLDRTGYYTKQPTGPEVTALCPNWHETDNRIAYMQHSRLGGQAGWSAPNRGSHEAVGLMLIVTTDSSNIGGNAALA